jgi:hypothetical protein
MTGELPALPSALWTVVFFAGGRGKDRGRERDRYWHGATNIGNYFLIAPVHLRKSAICTFATTSASLYF